MLRETHLAPQKESPYSSLEVRENGLVPAESGRDKERHTRMGRRLRRKERCNYLERDTVGSGAASHFPFESEMKALRSGAGARGVNFHQHLRETR